jgi:hypothetical protein
MKLMSRGADVANRSIATGMGSRGISAIPPIATEVLTLLVARFVLKTVPLPPAKTS